MVSLKSSPAKNTYGCNFPRTKIQIPFRFVKIVNVIVAEMVHRLPENPQPSWSNAAIYPQIFEHRYFPMALLNAISAAIPS